MTPNIGTIVLVVLHESWFVLVNSHKVRYGGAAVVLAVIMGLMALSSNPASATPKAKASVKANSQSSSPSYAPVKLKAAKANARFSWSAPSSSLDPGETVTVTAKFGRKCRHRDVVLQERRAGQAWSTLYTVNSDRYPSMAFSLTSYQKGAISYRVRAMKTKSCSTRASEVQTYVTTETQYPDQVPVG